MDARTRDKIEALLAKGHAERCPSCDGVSAYAWEDVDDVAGIEHIGATSGLGEWQCGHCRAHWVDRDSPLNAECYTHRDPYDEGDDE